jgi:hypothetical protein
VVNPTRDFRAEVTEKVRAELAHEGGKDEIFMEVKICTKELKATKGIFKMEWIQGVVKELEN